MHSDVPEMHIPAPRLVWTASEPLAIYILQTHVLWHIMGFRPAILSEYASFVSFTEDLCVSRRKFF